MISESKKMCLLHVLFCSFKILSKQYAHEPLQIIEIYFSDLKMTKDDFRSSI